MFLSNTKTASFLICLFAVAAIAGCDSSTENQDAQPSSPPLAYEGNSNTSHFEGEPTGNLSEAERAERMRRTVQAQIQVERILKEEQGWQGAHQSMQAFLKKPSPAGEAMQEQIVADAMLKRRLLTGGTLTPEQQEAVAFYTDLLMEHANPQGPLLSSALTHLEGYWPEARVARAAEQALEVTREQLASQKKEASESRSLIAKLTGEDTPGTHHKEQLRQLRQATSQLKTLAKVK